ncbi:DUF6397 family protein [Streptomyces sp. NPDC005899]|uniref:DUF6397 family protein n=1 Tax=Streptomyces sp. NPDC005899 TaxID=3155716 RepID=UPI0033D5C039
MDGCRARASESAGSRSPAAEGPPAAGAAETEHARDAGRAATHAEAISGSLSAARAAQVLSLKRGEFDLALHLGLLRAEAAPDGGAPRVHREEIDRLRATQGFPESLRERVRTAGTAEGAALLGIGPVRFTGLARVGCVSPVAFYLNRYRAVVWLYLVDELLDFAVKEPDLLAGKNPAGMRAMLEAGTDWRARNWRARRVDRLMCRARDPWVRAALQASALDPVQLAEVVDDPYERAYLARMQPDLTAGRPGSVAGREAMGRLMLADDPDEILWRRISLGMELDLARDTRAAPRPGGTRPGPLAVPGAVGPMEGGPLPGAFSGTGRPPPAGRGLLARIGLGRRSCAGAEPGAPTAPARRTGRSSDR